nr:hypothetical protein [Tanacetum cinerariifolium]
MLKKSVAERTRHKRQYDRRMNEIRMQSRESKVVSIKSLDASLVVTECSGTKSYEHITSNISRTYITHVVDADIRPVNDQEPSDEVNSRAKVQSPKSINNIKPAKRIPNVNKSKRWISKGYRFSPNKSFDVHEKPNTPRSCLRWKLKGRIFKTVGLSSGLAFHRQMASTNTSGPAPQRKERCTLNSRLVPQPPSPTPNLPPTKNNWDTVFYPLFDEYFNPLPRAISPVLVAIAAPRAVDLAGSPSSTIIDQDVP